eukprot:5048960-Prorocentrum_lima.AAC.1
MQLLSRGPGPSMRNSAPLRRSISSSDTIGRNQRFHPLRLRIGPLDPSRAPVVEGDATLLAILTSGQ